MIDVLFHGEREREREKCCREGERKVAKGEREREGECVCMFFSR